MVRLAHVAALFVSPAPSLGMGGRAGMGDKRRFREFAYFIHRTFPQATSVADVAGGRGELAFWLHELGHAAGDRRAARQHVPALGPPDAPQARRPGRQTNDH